MMHADRFDGPAGNACASYFATTATPPSASADDNAVTKQEAGVIIGLLGAILATGLLCSGYIVTKLNRRTLGPESPKASLDSNRNM